MSNTIVMIHGMWTGSWIWDKYKIFFENRGYKCFSPNLRFHNFDSKNTPDPRLGTTSLLDYAEDLEKEITELNETPILIGHSMGGLLAQILGSRGFAKSLVLLTPAPPAGVWDVPPDPETLRKGYQSVISKPNWFKEPIKPTFDEAVYSELHLLPPEEQKIVYDKWVYESGWANFEFGAWQSDPKKAAYVDNSNVTCPVLAVAALQDHAIPPLLVKKVAEYYHKVSTYKEFENHAHWLIGEPGWEDIAEYIGKWINSSNI
jgi:pimeloyl-ACP methyl ester carboxylesterase